MKLAGEPLGSLAVNLRQVLYSPMCWGLVIFTGAIHFAIKWMGGPNRPITSEVYLKFGLSREGFLGGNIWSLASYGLLHGSWWHWAMNGLFALLVGSRLEHVSGAAVVGRTVLLGVIGGGISHLFLTPRNGGEVVLVGLSGGCLALLLLLTTLSPESKMMPLPVSGKSLGLGLIVASLLLTVANLALSLPEFSHWGKLLKDYGFGDILKMGHACHLGGALAGWFYGRWLLRPRVTLDRLRAERYQQEADQKK